MASSKSTFRRISYWGGSLLAVVFVIGGLGWWMGWIGGGEAGLSVETERAQRRSVTQVVTAFGRAQPEVEVSISPDVSGEVVELSVREGDAVKKGDLLARLKPDDYRAQLKQQRARVSQQKATMAEREADSVQARRTYERQKTLHERGVVPESDLQDAQSAYEQAVARLQSARHQVESAEASLQDAREQLEKTRLYAPMNGTVSMLDVEVGERVVGTRERAGTEMMKVARLDQMELEIDVNENDVVNVSSRDTASIEVDAYPDRSFRGVVTEIANSARIENQGSQEQVTNFPVIVRVLDAPNTDLSAGINEGLTRSEVPTEAEEAAVLRPGMSGSVDIYTETVEDAVAVPIQAVTVRDLNEVRNAEDDTTVQATAEKEDLREVVFVAEGDSARMVEVTTGISDASHMVVQSGLSGGERVITGPYSAVSRELAPGTRIQTSSGPDGAREKVVATSQ